jgi:hypothetical protein
MPEYIINLLKTAEGRELVSDALRRVTMVLDVPPVRQTIDIRLIAYNASHRVVTSRSDSTPVSLIKVTFEGFDLFLVHDGNHRIEQARTFSQKIDAIVSRSQLKPYFVSADGTYFTRQENDPRWILNPIPDSLANVLIALNLKPLSDKRTYAA